MRSIEKDAEGKLCVRGKEKDHLMHWIRTDKVKSVCKRHKFTMIKKFRLFPTRYDII